MRMADVKVGMRLKSTLNVTAAERFATVTELTERGFLYNLDADIPLGPRYGVLLKDGCEHFGFNGEAYFEPVEAIEIQAPNEFLSYLDSHTISIFAGGSIEMNQASRWQQRLINQFAGLDVVILNPRRDDWHSDWEQSIDDPNFLQQVEWELRALDASDYIIMFLEPGTRSPISLLELGLHARTDKLLVVCPNGFWRKGNVDVVCRHYSIPQFDTIEQAVDFLKKEISRQS